MIEVDEDYEFYRVSARNGYYGVDEYGPNNNCIRHFDSFKTRKLADSVANELNVYARYANRLEKEIAELKEKLNHPWVKGFV